MGDNEVLVVEYLVLNYTFINIYSEILLILLIKDVFDNKKETNTVSDCVVL